MNWKLKRLIGIFSFITTILFTGCSNDTLIEPIAKTEQSNTDTEQLETIPFDGMTALLKVADEYFNKEEHYITPKEVYEKVILEKDSSYQIVDIRDEATFSNGNIEGSINIPYSQTANIELINQLPKDKKLIIVCFSGHTGSHTAAFWSMLGYDAVPMLNGMGGWTSNENLGTPIPSEAFDLPTDTGEVKNETYELPWLKTDANNLEDLLVLGTKAYFEKEYSAVKPAKVVFEEMIQKNNETTMIVDIRKKEDYEKGHIKDAINIPYTELANADNLKSIDPSKTIILVDYNGHIASAATRFLAIFGYEAYPIKDGMRVWTSDETINGIAPISSEQIYEYPVNDLNVDLDSEAGPASCS